MPPALKAVFHRFGTLLLAAAAGAAVQPGKVAQGALDAAQATAGPAEQETWAAAQRSGSAAAYQRYLELFPTGVYAEEAFRKIVEGSLAPRPVTTLVDIEPAAGPAAAQRELVVAAADLALY